MPTEDRCPECNQPIIKVISRGRRPWVICINMQCPLKAERNGKKAKVAKRPAKEATKKPRAPRKRKAKPAPVPEATVTAPA